MNWRLVGFYALIGFVVGTLVSWALGPELVNPLLQGAVVGIGLGLGVLVAQRLQDSRGR